VTIRARGVGSRVRFEVTDTGPGISPDRASHVFDRYWRADAADRRGSGLGLYIAKGIIEAHGGRIWVESQLGQGTAILFELPEAPAVEDSRQPSPGASGLPPSPRPSGNPTAA
jgi:signal transduction histidine kinase